MPRLELTGLRRLVVISAHPDDETLGAGALIATAARLGVPITVIVATAGEGSHPDSPTHRPDQLAVIRRRE
ncbi:MAG: PIG-L family deacetylase, partial [Nakamurella sp.]